MRGSFEGRVFVASTVAVPAQSLAYSRHKVSPHPSAWGYSGLHKSPALGSTPSLQH